MTAGSITDVRGIRVGHWTDRRALTGCTVVLPDVPAVAGVDVRGAAPGTRETDLLRPGNLVQHVHGIVLAGGSAYGLEAASGVMRYLAERKIGFAFGRGVVPIVPAAILFDLGVGRPDRWPTMEAGYRAAAAARRTTAEGNIGAGMGATVGKALGPERAMKGGTGTASEASVHGLITGALAAVNASGDVVDPDTGRLLAGARRDDGTLDATLTVLREGRIWQPEIPSQSTVLVVVATNAALTKEQANRLAAVCHDGIARAVRPAHTQSDGDIVFTLATGERALEGADYRIVEALATRAVERVIVRGVTEAESLPGLPAYCDVAAARRRSR
ncbi:MAG TPA: P1 family peptidase [Dehalococcoidia bacterium]|nr:P1 family peptidase [Dehalococcoidia bacterium]